MKEQHTTLDYSSEPPIEVWEKVGTYAGADILACGDRRRLVDDDLDIEYTIKSGEVKLVEE